MLNGNKSKSSRRAVSAAIDLGLRATKKSVVAGREKKAARRAANQNVMRDVWPTAQRETW